VLLTAVFSELNRRMKDLGKAFSFVFKDPAWIQKVLLAMLWMLLALVGIGFFVLAGYYIQLTQRVMRREEFPLPSWSGIGHKLWLGLKLAIVFLVYLLPVILLMIPAIGLSIAVDAAPDSDTLAILTSVYLFGYILLILPYSFALTALTPIISVFLAERERISDAIDIVRVFSFFRRNWQNTLIVALIALGIQSVAGLGVFFFLIGVLATIHYSYVVTCYLNGLLYLEAASRTQGNPG
jgi:hypothetical protein